LMFLLDPSLPVRPDTDYDQERGSSALNRGKVPL
jgi:hypothetical protein